MNINGDSRLESAETFVEARNLQLDRFSGQMANVCVYDPGNVVRPRCMLEAHTWKKIRGKWKIQH